VIEWAGTQGWSNGMVGLLGVSYLAVNLWQVAATKPAHLAAICPWEGAFDFYRDIARHGGILQDYFWKLWWPKQVIENQHGNAGTRYFDRDTGERTTGPALPAEVLRANRIDFFDEVGVDPLDGDWHRARTPCGADIEIPILSAGNWGGQGLHLRGNVEGYLAAGSGQKWLELHGGTHFETFYMPEWVALQRRFFDHFLKGAANGWDKTPPVILRVRYPDRFETRLETSWPLAGTRWVKAFLDAEAATLREEAPEIEQVVSYDPLISAVEFRTAPFANETEITGPVSAKLWVSSDGCDLDLFLTLRAYNARGEEIVFPGATDPAVPVSQGWLRASQRELCPERSAPWRPFHSHQNRLLLEQGQAVCVEVEIWPTSIVLSQGCVLELRIEGKDFERPGSPYLRKGSGPFLHQDSIDRDPAVFGKLSMIHTGGQTPSHLLLPIIAR
jgi:predicted acyl esterase